MDTAWLINSNSTLASQDAAIIVPTRSLATSLNERFARVNIEQGLTVWEAPTILVWSEYLHLLWESNRVLFGEQSSALTLISSQQSLLLWNQVIEASRRDESALTLLNVQQTSRAAQRSWRLMNDWRISLADLTQDHAADTTQFALWVKAYRALLDKRALLDDSSLTELLSLPNLIHPFKKLFWVSYDLVTSAQQAYLDCAVDGGVEIEFVKPTHKAQKSDYYIFDDTSVEIKAALHRARRLLEKNPEQTISLVIPDLQHRQASVHELAREVFYSTSSPLQVQQNNKVYQFSLGQPLNEWAAIEAALSVMQLLKNRTSVTDIGFILRNSFLGLCVKYRSEGRRFERWLKDQRTHDLLFDNLPDLYRQYQALVDNDNAGQQESEFCLALEKLALQRQSMQERLMQERTRSGFVAMGFSQWLQIFSDWLQSWGWRCSTSTDELSGVQYQLQLRWQRLLEEFAGLATVQRSAGLNRALEVLQQMSRNAIFLPKAAVSPIVISGVLEAVGREVDTCILTGMHYDYPTPPKSDAFVPNRLLAIAGHPEATAESGFKQAGVVIENLLSCAQNRVVSYARSSDHDQEVSQKCSALFKQAKFERESHEIELRRSDVKTDLLEHYVDKRGPSWTDPGRARGGSRIFENQSLCAFKAFATHQLQFDHQDESEFGLDGLDRGNVLHHCLNLLWQEIQSQSQLASMSEVDRIRVIDGVINAALTDGKLVLSGDKPVLLKHEVPRLQTILLDWLKIEDKRPLPFSVVEREERREGELGGIRFRYIIDRVDVTEDGRSVVIDYKTGAVNRNDWIGDRLKSPQMPLYALALDQAKRNAVSGIAFAQIKQGGSKYIELSESNIFRKASDKKQLEGRQLWESNRAAWPQIFSQLADDFLNGEASVDPIDQQTCEYCKLQPLCRISQLRAQS